MGSDTNSYFQWLSDQTVQNSAFFLLLDHFSVYFPNKAKRWRFSLFTCQVTTQNYALHILQKFFVLVTKKRLINQFLVLHILFENPPNVSLEKYFNFRTKNGQIGTFRFCQIGLIFISLVSWFYLIMLMIKIIETFWTILNHFILYV